jgi:hypothetical protein
MFRPVWSSSGVKNLVWETAVIACVPSMCTLVVLGVLCIALRTKQTTANNRKHSTRSTTYLRIEGTHAIAAE